MNPGMELSMDRVQIVAIARREIAEHFEYLKANFSGSHGEVNPSEERKIEFGPLADITVDELTLADFSMWYRLKHTRKGSVTPADLEIYRKDVEKDPNPSRRALQVSIANEITALVIEKEEKSKKRKVNL